MTLTVAPTTPSKMGKSSPSDIITIDKDTLAMVQRGFYSAASFYGNQGQTSNHKSFTSGLGGISMFSGFATSLREKTVKERKDTDTQYQLTEAEYNLVIKRAKQIAAYGNVPVDVVEDFLFMLIAVSSIDDLAKIAIAIELDTLNNVQLLRNPVAILDLPGLEKIAFMASALSALLKAFSKYGSAEAKSVDGMDDIGSIFDSLGSLLGGFGQGLSAGMKEVVNTPAPNKAIGNFMSELVLGKRIPMSVIAKNPNLQSPSFVGKALFGEAPTALSNIDINQIFAKKIGVFPKPSSGGATTSFGISNFNAFAGQMSVDQLVSKIMFGKSEVSETSNKYNSKQKVLDIVKDITGAQSTDQVETNRADNIIPMMLGLSAGLPGLEKAPFSVDTFKQSWVTSMSASNFMQGSNPALMQAFKKLV